LYPETGCRVYADVTLLFTAKTRVSRKPATERQWFFDKLGIVVVEVSNIETSLAIFPPKYRRGKPVAR
jgi:hypothetical protein